MLPIINLTSNRKFRIRNFEEDKNATLNSNRGLRYDGLFKKNFKFSGEFYLTNTEGAFIESFSVVILIGKNYPNAFPVVLVLDDKIEKSDAYHINKDGIICFEHSYVINVLIKRSIRLFDFVNYYLPKYFSWVLVKKYGNAQILDEWAHKDEGNIQFYQCLLNTNDKRFIRLFLESYCKISKFGRNDKCFCESGKKLKLCHYEEAVCLRSTTKLDIKKDIELFQ